MITVIQAIYASNNRGYDVTRVAQTVFSGGGGLFIDNGTFGSDPDKGATKYFAMQYRVGSSDVLFIGAAEGQVIQIPDVPGGAVASSGERPARSARSARRPLRS